MIQTSANAYLQMIYLDGTPLPGFVSQKTDGYVYQLQGETCPKITVDKEEGQQVTITAPYGEGAAQIKVAVNGVVGNTYETIVPIRCIMRQAIRRAGRRSR